MLLTFSSGALIDVLASICIYSAVHKANPRHRKLRRAHVSAFSSWEARRTIGPFRPPTKKLGNLASYLPFHPLDSLKYYIHLHYKHHTVQVKRSMSTQALKLVGKETPLCSELEGSFRLERPTQPPVSLHSLCKKNSLRWPMVLRLLHLSSANL